MDWTQVSHTAGRFFTSWATREAQEYWSGYPIPSPGDLPGPGIELGSPALQVGFFFFFLPTELLGKPSYRIRKFKTLRLMAEMLLGFQSWSAVTGREAESLLLWTQHPLLLLASPCPHPPPLSLSQPSRVNPSITSHRKAFSPGVRGLFLFISLYKHLHLIIITLGVCFPHLKGRRILCPTLLSSQSSVRHQ